MTAEQKRKLPVVETDLHFRVHDHDVRLARLETRVETELDGIHTKLKEQQDEIHENKILVMQVLSDIGTVLGQNKMIILLLGLSATALGGLELWAVFR